MKIVLTILVIGVGSLLQILGQNAAGITNVTVSQAFLLNTPSMLMGVILAWIWIPRVK